MRSTIGRLLRAAVPAKLKKIVRGFMQHRVADRKSIARYFTDKTALEIGGPSRMFGEEGELPLYSSFETVDNCLYSSDTIWTGPITGDNRFVYLASKPPGHQFICDATELTPIRDSQYDAILASHCLEHVANPFRALNEWKRCLKPGGLLLMVLPHKDGTFDWKRPTTELSHMIRDEQQGTTEKDLTHLPEILEFHDLSKDKAAGTKEQFHQRCLDNFKNRAMHQHVFTTPSAVKMLDHAGFEIVSVSNVKPYHIIIVARLSQQPNNAAFLSSAAAYLNRSPFASDQP